MDTTRQTINNRGCEMNALINSQQPCSILEMEENEVDVQTGAEIFAIALLSFLVTSVFTVSGWSAILLLT